MLSKLILHNSDLKRLMDEGYEIEVRGGHLIVHQIPYVNSKCELMTGKLITPLELSGEKTIKPQHTIHFMGEHPCHNDGSILTSIKHSEVSQKLYDDIDLNFMFSNKPQNGYDNHYEKVIRYIELITAPAKSIDKNSSAATFKVIECDEEHSIFNYLDTNSSRANINFINDKFKGMRIGIIGLGGTGSYILDLVAKTPVDEILLFDDDEFLLHNAFRAPGAPSIETLNKKMKKVDYFTSLYSNMRKNIVPHRVKIVDENAKLLKDLDFVFISVDSNIARNTIISKLLNFQVPFIDVGLGVEIKNDTLTAILRATLGTETMHEHLPTRIGSINGGDDEYSTNIQIADLNAMNALMAVIKWKRYIGFYKDLKEEHNITFTVNTGQMLSDDFAT